MRKLFLLLTAILLGITNMMADTYVNLRADFDGNGNWTDIGIKWPDEAGGQDGDEAVWKGVTFKGEGKFCLKVWDGNKDTYYTTDTNSDPATVYVSTSNWANKTSSTQKNLKISGWSSSKKYDVYFKYGTTGGGNKQLWIVESTDTPVGDQSLYIYGNVKQDGVYSDTTDGTLLTKNSDGDYETTLTLFESTNSGISYFRFYDADSKKIWSCGSSNVTANLSSANDNTDITNYYDKGNWQQGPGKYKVVLKADCSSFTITKDNGGGGGDDDQGAGIYMMTAYRNSNNNGLGSWSETKLSESTDNPGIYEYTITDYEGNKNLYIYFEKRDAKNTVLNSYGHNSRDFGDNQLNNRQHISEGNTYNLTTWTGKVDCGYEIYQNAGDIKFKLDFSDTNNPSLALIKAPVVVTPPSLADDATRAGKVYLLGNVLNDNYPSPAWEMEKQTSGEYAGKYLIEDFAMRYTNADQDHFFVAVYDEAGKATVTQFPTLANLPVPGQDGHQKTNNRFFAQPGWSYRAVYDATAGTLEAEPMTGGTFADDKLKNVMPYVGILGQNFVQSNKYKTRKTYRSLMGNTSLGWQEAYIEYGASGQPIFEADGTAYYNTVWPPRHNILMQSQLGEGATPLKVSTNDLTMKRDGNIKTGADWMTYLQDIDSDQYSGLQLVEGKTYLRYTVTNMWMLGDFKIWTGWGGEDVSENEWGANWDKHVYWGPVNGDYANSAVKPHVTLNTSDESVNFYTRKLKEDKEDAAGESQRSYFRTLELFIPYNTDMKGLDYSNGAAKLYATEADGGAQIDAIAQGKYVGYNPTLATEIPDGYYVKDYTITRYAWEPNVKPEQYAELLSPVDRNRVPKDKEGDARVEYQPKPTDAEGNIITDNEVFNSLFVMSDSFDKKYKQDTENEYAEGRYVFRLEVIFASTTGDATKKADVWSPYVEVIDDNYNLTLYPRQLISLEDVDAEIKGNYTHITYNPSHNGKLVRIEGNAITDIDNADLPVETTTEIYNETGVWTNLHALVSALPAQFLRQGDRREVKTFHVAATEQETLTDAKDFELVNSFYVALFDDKAVEKVPYTAEFAGTIYSYQTDGSQTWQETTPCFAHTTYTPTFPLPYFEEPEFGMTAHESNGNWNPTWSRESDNEDNKRNFGVLNKWSFSHEHVSGGATEQKNAFGHELTLTVPVHMPKIESTIKEAVYSKLNDLVVKHNDDSHAVTVTNADATHALVYRNLSPYNWLTPDEGNPYFWKADEHNYAIDGSYTGIETYKPYAATGVTAALNPIFEFPKVDEFQLYGELYVEGDESFNPGDYNTFPKYDVIKARLYLTNLRFSLNQDNEPSSLREGLEDLVSGEKGVYVFHAYNDEPENSPNKVDKGFIFDDTQNVFDKDGASRILIHEGAEFRPKAGETGMAFAERIGNEWMKQIKVELGHAYMFNAKADGAVSQYEGFDGEDFPYVRKTESNVAKAPAARVASADGEYVRGSYGTDSKLIKDGDDSYLFSPIYLVRLLTDDAVTTGVFDITLDSATNVASGKGYIDLLGNEGTIFAADGRQVYTGDARAELPRGVYIVTLKGRTVKVLVK